jgi:hypothetical protein
MQIAAADAHGLHLEENVFFTDARNREFAKLNRVRILCVIDQTNHSDLFCVIGNAKSNRMGKVSFLLLTLEAAIHQISKVETVNLLLL